MCSAIILKYIRPTTCTNGIRAHRAAAAAAGVRLLLLTSVPCLLHNFERLLLEAFRDVRAIEQAGSYLRTFAQ